MMQEAYKASSDKEVKLRYAHVLGLLNDNTGVDDLMTAVSEAKWDKGWKFRG